MIVLLLHEDEAGLLSEIIKYFKNSIVGGRSNRKRFSDTVQRDNKSRASQSRIWDLKRKPVWLSGISWVKGARVCIWKPERRKERGLRNDGSWKPGGTPTGRDPLKFSIHFTAPGSHKYAMERNGKYRWSAKRVRAYKFRAIALSNYPPWKDRVQRFFFEGWTTLTSFLGDSFQISRDENWKLSEFNILWRAV